MVRMGSCSKTCHMPLKQRAKQLLGHRAYGPKNVDPKGQKVRPHETPLEKAPKGLHITP